VGMNLAYAEMYLWLSGVFRRFGSKEVRFEGDGMRGFLNWWIQQLMMSRLLQTALCRTSRRVEKG
jgi:hypothetical protein